MLDDLRHAARSLIRSPGFTVAAVLVLGLGIGAAAMMFVIADAYFLRPADGVVEPARLVRVSAVLGGRDRAALTYLDYADLRAWSRAFAGLAAYRLTTLDVGSGGPARRVPAAIVSGNFFAVLGVHAVLGRTFRPDEERPVHGHPVAVIGHRLWRDAFAGDSGIVGRVVALNGHGFTVVGVAAPGFRGHLPDEGVDVWVPLAMGGEADPEGLVSVENRTWNWLDVLGRLGPGVELAAADAEARVLARRLGAAGAGNGRDFGLALEPARRPLTHDAYGLLLVAGVGVLLLVVCANVSSMYLARASARRREIATRLAFGAPRSRIVRRLLAETVTVGLLGGLVGFWVGAPLATAALAWSSAGVGDPLLPLGPSLRLAWFVLALSVAAGCLLGLWPALQLAGVDVAAGLREGIGGRAAGRSRARALLVVPQVALSLVLLSGGGLLFRTLRNYGSLVRVPDPERVLLVSVQPSHEGYDAERARDYFRRLVGRVAGLPGVRSATIARDAGFGDASFFADPVAAEQGGLGPGASPRSVGYNAVAPGYFSLLGIPLLRGRDFTAADRSGAPPVVIVNATLARRLWPGSEPLGRLLWIGAGGGAREVVGVVADRPTRDGLQPFFYYALSQGYPWPGSAHELHVRTAGDPLALLPAVRREAAALDATVALFDPRSVERDIAGARFFERLAGVLLGGAGLLAMLLAAIGLFGVTSHWVVLRTVEIGVRVALGAAAGAVMQLVIRQAFALALAGVAIGLVAALALNHALGSLLYGVRPADPATLGLAAAVLLAAALLAACLPARRAARVDPMTALRCE